MKAPNACKGSWLVEVAAAVEEALAVEEVLAVAPETPACDSAWNIAPKSFTGPPGTSPSGKSVPAGILAPPLP